MLLLMFMVISSQLLLLLLLYMWVHSYIQVMDHHYIIIHSSISLTQYMQAETLVLTKPNTSSLPPSPIHHFITPFIHPSLPPIHHFITPVSLPARL